MLDISRENDINDLESKRSNATLNNIIGQLKGISEKRDTLLIEKKERSYIYQTVF